MVPATLSLNKFNIDKKITFNDFKSLLSRLNILNHYYICGSKKTSLRYVMCDSDDISYIIKIKSAFEIYEDLYE